MKIYHDKTWRYLVTDHDMVGTDYDVLELILR